MTFWRNDYFVPVVLIVLGAYFLLRNTGWLDWLSGDILWPVLLIMLGVWLIVRRARV